MTLNSEWTCKRAEELLAFIRHFREELGQDGESMIELIEDRIVERENLLKDVKSIEARDAPYMVTTMVGLGCGDSPLIDISQGVLSGQIKLLKEDPFVQLCLIFTRKNLLLIEDELNRALT